MKYLFLLLLFCSLTHMAQNPWIPTNSILTGRYDDISFVSPDTGWAVGTTSGPTGNVFHTTDGGNTWINQKTLNNTYIRSVEFADKNIGFVGALDFGGGHVFYKTTDGGNNWTDISSVITATTSRGICGICCVNTSVTYAVGVWSSPSYVLKTIDGGNNWTQINMGAYANALVDVEFTDPNNGYVTGQSNISSEGAVILKTTDGGATWTKVFVSNQAGEYLWKIQNLDGQNWFASIESTAVADSIHNVFLKSTDGGNTWITKPVAYSNIFQGIGFINTQRGWIGNEDLFETNDGGDNWVKVTNSNANQFNRFQRINATTAYFSSSQVCKLGNTTTAVPEKKNTVKTKWLSVFPNPAKDEISYTLNLPQKTMFAVRLFNSKGEIIWEDINQKEKGSYHFKIDRKLSPGVYHVYVMFNEGVECEKVIVN